ncbi:transmembrane protein [Achlya hypogyna]|uniref:Transmembrane protein n=1 Tax=Achlya hypogyna TaxID=1202772 RepID=A0A1V9ZKL1_ACHHY|nr:transmembrane protein [Achlya hypogyna]
MVSSALITAWVAAALIGADGQPTTPSLFESRRSRKCLDASWVSSTAKSLGLDPDALDWQHRKVNPVLRPALERARFILNDPRQHTSRTFDSRCFQPSESFHGVGETIYANGTVANRGICNGTVVLEYNTWESQTMTTTVLAILISEVVGYQVSYFITDGGLDATERMASVGLGTCSPTHVNVEVWTASKLSLLDVFANETSSSAIGYNGQWEL